MESANKIVTQNSRQHHSSLYGECLKNHAAALGAHATDGCGEFIDSPSSLPSDPTSLTCAACGCHRNFHRRVAPGVPPSSSSDDDQEAECTERSHPREEHHHHHRHHEDDEEAGSHVLLSLKTGGGGGGGGGGPGFGAKGKEGKKRFRSTFSREQKEGMMELAERVGWRLQRRDKDTAVEDGCRAIGVDRAVFKIWMHNNKQAVLQTKRRQQAQQHNNGSNNVEC